MTWLSQWRKKTVLLGLLLHFLLWWILSSWFWTHGFGWNLWSMASAIAPLYLGISCLQPHGYWQWGIQGLMAFIALGGLIVLSLRTLKRWVVLLAHAALVVYWFYSFLLIPIGV